MASVTRRIKQIKQPRGGYIPPKQFSKTALNDNIELYEEENIDPRIIGMAVDYLTRYSLGYGLERSFQISLMGAHNIGAGAYAQKLLDRVNGLDNTSIIKSCKLAGYDVCYRAGPAYYKPIRNINPNENTINNIRTMVERSLRFFESYGPVICEGFRFKGGYTSIINNGDGDFLTEDTLWDFKVSKYAPTSQHTLQLLIYYLMGIHSFQKKTFSNIENLGIFNPRLNSVYLFSIAELSQEIIDEVEEKVIGYRNFSFRNLIGRLFNFQKQD